MTLAMARHSRPLENIFTASSSYSPAGPVRSAVILIHPEVGLEKSQSKIKNDFSSGSLLEKQSQPGFGDPLLLARENLGSNRSVSVRAGYEQGWGDGSVLQKISPDEQEPGFACIKASFSF